MAWVLLDDNFPTHPKVTAAGPVAAHLFVCGLCYCRRYHTDGLISAEAVVNLAGAVGAVKLASRLVEVRLWEPVPGGYQVHQYQEMYADSEDKAKQERKRALWRSHGRAGGLASGQSRAKQTKRNVISASTETTKSLEAKPPDSSKRNAVFREAESNPYGIGSGTDLEFSLGEESEEGAPFDAWFRQLIADFPAHRVTSGHMTEQAFIGVFSHENRPPAIVWAEMQANLANQKAGYQWRVKGMTPKLETWLREGAWRQKHSPDPPEVEPSPARAGRPAWTRS